MWAVVRRRSRRLPVQKDLRSLAQHANAHPRHPTPLLASPEGLSHLPEYRWRMPGPRAHCALGGGRSSRRSVR
eukprot:5700193-Prymnesium_polylepis.1